MCLGSRQAPRQRFPGLSCGSRHLVCAARHSDGAVPVAGGRGPAHGRLRRGRRAGGRHGAVVAVPAARRSGRRPRQRPPAAAALPPDLRTAAARPGAGPVVGWAKLSAADRLRHRCRCDRSLRHPDPRCPAAGRGAQGRLAQGGGPGDGDIRSYFCSAKFQFFCL